MPERSPRPRCRRRISSRSPIVGARRNCPRSDRSPTRPCSSLPSTPGAPPPIDPTASSPAGPTNDDPEKNARAFVEQNRKVAQDELKKLKDEAERLRTRLGKVEAGIRRWEALLAALENSEKPVERVAFDRPLPDAGPTELEPAPIGEADACRSPVVAIDGAPPSALRSS